jgi:hypothetical protein
VSDYNDNDYGYNEMHRNWGKESRQQPPFKGGGYEGNRKNDDLGWYSRQRPDDGYTPFKPRGPKDPDAGSGSNAKEMPKTEEFERTEAPERRFIEAPSLELARKV